MQFEEKNAEATTKIGNFEIRMVQVETALKGSNSFQVVGSSKKPRVGMIRGLISNRFQVLEEVKDKSGLSLVGDSLVTGQSSAIETKIGGVCVTMSSARGLDIKGTGCS